MYNSIMLYFLLAKNYIIKTHIKCFKEKAAASQRSNASKQTSQRRSMDKILMAEFSLQLSCLKSFYGNVRTTNNTAVSKGFPKSPRIT